MSFTLNSTAKLNNGVQIPRLGLGVYQIPPGKSTVKAVKYALEIGYKHFDTAKIYGNESDVGKALKESDVKREDIFITTKVWNSDQGYNSTLKALESSLKRLGLSYVDLYLIHWPVQGKIIETWKAMIKLLNSGKVNAIGVSNYSINELKETIHSSDTVPAINQVEFHPFLNQKDLLQFCKSNVIQLEAYSPLTRGERLNDPNIVRIAKAYDKTSAQILVRWSLQHDLVVIPKSSHEERILENSQVFDFHINQKDMEILDLLNEDLSTVFLD
ncbi:aldo/keto reductase [Candidatus Nitrosocosmicus arcticus]|uniref:Putative oxidoreductase YtbE n=1 Tax=Candidatus Nitrosocosmicus arcticus TaxID=2035267 RepID=A0A557SRR6_9ARCH|nr:aldo/keto reductase [Candidatus Nitrosocosmicus arcticus]TVP39289.1 putative oxidoreductase YtbE [Candidatus Nitrosocosmicus arcticus]